MIVHSSSKETHHYRTPPIYTQCRTGILAKSTNFVLKNIEELAIKVTGSPCICNGITILTETCSLLCGHEVYAPSLYGWATHPRKWTNPYGAFLLKQIVTLSLLQTRNQYPSTNQPGIGNDNTRQLPMGAGHCQWGGFTDRNVCNIPKFRPLGP